MRLLMTTDTIGGVWTFNMELARGLLAEGCEIVLVSLGRLPSPSQQGEADLLFAGGKFEYIATEAPLEWQPANDSAYTSAEPLLMRLCHDFRPGALLLSQFCFGALPVPVPKFVISHSDVLSWSAAVSKVSLAEDRWLIHYRNIVQAGLDGATLLIAPTHAVLKGMTDHYRLPTETVVIANGRSLHPETKRIPRVLQAISAGRMWDPAKNLHLLTGLHAPLPIRIAGENNGYDTQGSSLIFLGQRSESDLLMLLRESAIYICASMYEPFGLAPLEAALCGCAVVANDIPSLREVWADAALYFRTADDLEAILRALTDDAELLAAAQRRSVLRAQEYTTERMANHYLQTIRDLNSCKVNGESRAA
ncbi:MAG: glycosyltransferase [Janthinobacterium lividum]